MTVPPKTGTARASRAVPWLSRGAAVTVAALCLLGSREAQALPGEVEQDCPVPERVAPAMPVKIALRPFGFTGASAVSPVEFGLVASGFGYRRARLRRRRQFHAGIDFRAQRGTAVLAARTGVVLHVASETERLHGFLGYGNAVVVHHPDTDDFSFYAHLSEVLVQVGDQLVAGEKLGRVGNTNNHKFRGMTSHLHFEVRQRDSDGREPFPGPYRDNAIDPLAWLLQHGMELGERRAVGLACRPPTDGEDGPLAVLEALEQALALNQP